MKEGVKMDRRGKSTLTAGIIATFLCSIFFTAMSGCARMLEPMPSGELTFFRGFFGLLFIPLIAWQNGQKIFSGTHVGLLTLRGVFGSIALYLYFLSIEGLTLGDGQILGQLSAFFMCILAPVFLKEKMPRQVIPALSLIALGAMVVMQVWNFASFNVYALYGALGGLSCAGAYMTISMLGERGFKSDTEIVFYFQLWSLITGLLLMMKEDFLMPHGIQWFWALAIGLTALIAQMLMTWAFQHIHSIIVSFIMFSQILFHIIMGRIFWGETMTLWSWIGGAFIVAGSMALLMIKSVKNK